MKLRIRELLARPFTLRGGAAWLSSLRARLALATGVTVAITVGFAVWLSLTAARQVLAQEVIEVVVRTAERAADAVELVPDPITRDAVVPIFSAILASVPTAQHVSLLVPRGQTPRVLAQSGTAPTTTGLEMAQRALASGRSEVLNDEQTVRAAVPVSRNAKLFGVILVRGDLRSMMALQQRALRSVVVFAVLAGVGLVLLVDLAARSIVYRPIQHLRRTIAKAAAGDLSARVKVTRRDELGQVAQGLNDMLTQMEQFNQTLQGRVRQAMSEVEAQNAQLMESYRRVFLLREELATAEHLAAVGQTAANVAHEVGTPLNLISGYVQLAKEDVPTDSPLAGRLAIIEEQIAKVTTAVRELLNRSRHTGTRARRSAGALIDQVSDAIRPNLEPAGIGLEIAWATDGAVELLVDSTNMEVALHNLLINAVDAMPGGGTITVGVSSPQSDVLRIEIRDSGQGISADLLPQIFDPFVSTKPPGRGSGLGLAIARDVVAAHGGTIAVASEPGRGTTFIIDLPTTPAGSAAAGTI